MFRAIKRNATCRYVSAQVLTRGSFPAHSAPPACEPAAPVQKCPAPPATKPPVQKCVIGTIDLAPVSSVISVKNEAECEARYPAACDNGAARLIKDCKSKCAGHKEYKNTSPLSQSCTVKLPVTTHRPEYLRERDCALEIPKPYAATTRNDKLQWTVSCAVTAQSCACN